MTENEFKNLKVGDILVPDLTKAKTLNCLPLDKIDYLVVSTPTFFQYNNNCIRAKPKIKEEFNGRLYNNYVSFTENTEIWFYMYKNVLKCLNLQGAAERESYSLTW